MLPQNGLNHPPPLSESPAPPAQNHPPSCSKSPAPKRLDSPAPIQESQESFQESSQESDSEGGTLSRATAPSPPLFDPAMDIGERLAHARAQAYNPDLPADERTAWAIIANGIAGETAA